jgi:hypothetical protein
MDCCWFNATTGQFDPALDSPSTLVLLFGDASAEFDPFAFDLVRTAYPTSTVVGCSTSGHLRGTQVYDSDIVGLAVRFDHTRVRSSSVTFNSAADSFPSGAQLASELNGDDLAAVVLLTDGVQINGGELIEGLMSGLPEGTPIAGGLAGDQARFSRTWVLAGPDVSSGRVAAVGLYGDRLRLRFGSMGGWDAFGPSRTVTASVDRKVLEIDGRPALQLYKSYLGMFAADLPSSALLFPLAVQSPNSPRPLVRTILGVDEADQSLTFTSQIPVGSKAQLMRASADMLLDGALQAAEQCGRAPMGSFALAVSCVGRRLVLGERFEEELDAVHLAIGSDTPLIGFYSNGEFSPSHGSNELHNQTMTIAVFSEV